MNARSTGARTWLAAAAVTLGVGAGTAGIASAASDSSSTAGAATAAAPSSGTAPNGAPPAGAADPSTLKNGPGETLLTGTVAERVTAAAKAAVPGGTIIRVETDAQGATYEAHVRKADGSIVTLKLDASFKVTGTESGFGGPGGGSHGGAPPAGGQAPTAAAPAA